MRILAHLCHRQAPTSNAADGQVRLSGDRLMQGQAAVHEEVRARGGILYVFADADAKFQSDDTMRVINVPHVADILAPIVYTLPLQLLSYYVAIIKGTDVDQPRNLAKSVTVE